MKYKYYAHDTALNKYMWVKEPTKEVKIKGFESMSLYARINPINNLWVICEKGTGTKLSEDWRDSVKGAKESALKILKTKTKDDIIKALTKCGYEGIIKTIPKTDIFKGDYK